MHLTFIKFFGTSFTKQNQKQRLLFLNDLIGQVKFKIQTHNKWGLVNNYESL